MRLLSLKPDPDPKLFQACRISIWPGEAISIVAVALILEGSSEHAVQCARAKEIMPFRKLMSRQIYSCYTQLPLTDRITLFTLCVRTGF